MTAVDGMPQSAPRRGRGVVIAISAIVVGLVATTSIIRAMLIDLGKAPMGEFNPMAFDAALWRQSEIEFSWESIRLRMVDDLLARDILAGMSREQVIDLIGPPTETSKFSEYDLAYLLGLERGYMAIDGEWLLIRLGDDARVVEAFTATD